MLYWLFWRTLSGGQIPYLRYLENTTILSPPDALTAFSCICMYLFGISSLA